MKRPLSVPSPLSIYSKAVLLGLIMWPMSVFGLTMLFVGIEYVEHMFGRSTGPGMGITPLIAGREWGSVAAILAAGIFAIMGFRARRKAMAYNGRQHNNR